MLQLFTAEDMDNFLDEHEPVAEGQGGQDTQEKGTGLALETLDTKDRPTGQYVKGAETITAPDQEVDSFPEKARPPNLPGSKKSNVFL